MTLERVLHGFTRPCALLPASQPWNLFRIPRLLAVFSMACAALLPLRICLAPYCDSEPSLQVPPICLFLSLLFNFAVESLRLGGGLASLYC